MTLEEKIEVIRAFNEGKEIQVYDEHYEKWRRKCTDDFWDFNIYKYRVKPQPTIPTRLEVANELYEKTFGIAGRFTKHTCIAQNCKDCPLKEQHPCCDVESWWNAPYEEPEIEK